MSTKSALGREAIPGDNPAGIDAKYEADYGELSAEIAKLSSVTQAGAVNWSLVAERGERILAELSKDLQIAAYVGIAWQELRGLEGLNDAVQLLFDLYSTFWEQSYPPLTRLRRRTNAFDWWHERALAGLEKSAEGPACAVGLSESLLEGLSKLDTLSAELLPDANPLRDMLEAVRHLPLETVQESVPDKGAEHSQEKVPQDSSKVSSEESKNVQVAQASVQAPPQPKPEKVAAEEARSSQREAPKSVQHAVTAESDTAVDANELSSACKDFQNAAIHYAFLAHRASFEDPVPWQLLRIALWSKVTKLPPASNGETHVPPVDEDRLDGLRRLLEAGKYLEAARGAEDLFSSSIFCLDVQYIAYTALKGLGTPYENARSRLEEECRRLLERLPGLEDLAFDGGRPFADEVTRDWLATLKEASSGIVRQSLAAEVSATSSADASSANVLAQAGELAAQGEIQKALSLLEEAESVSPSVNMQLRVGELELLNTCREYAVASLLAKGLLLDLEERGLESWDPALALKVLLASREAFTHCKDLERARSVQERIARLRPSAAVGWKQ